MAPGELDVAAAVLSELGYVPRCPKAAPGEQADHATEWDRPQSPTIDLHNILSGRVKTSPERCWEIVSAHTQQATVGGADAHVLSPPALAVHAVLHAQAGKTKTIDDLRRTLARLDVADWRKAFDIAVALDAVAAFGVGLRLIAEGEQMADLLGVPTDVSVQLFLQATSTGSLAHPFEHVASTPGVLPKARLVCRELVPSPSFIRVWFPAGSRGPGWLLAGYLYRLIWVPWHAPRGLQAWRRARRAIATGAPVRADSFRGST